MFFYQQFINMWELRRPVLGLLWMVFHFCLKQDSSCSTVLGLLCCIVLSWWKVWNAGRPVQQPDSSTIKSCCCSMPFSVVLLKYAGKRRHLDGSIWCFKTCIHLTTFMVPVQMRELPTPLAIAPYHQRCRLLNPVLITSWMVPLSLVQRMQRSCFSKSILTLYSTDHIIVSQIHFNELWREKMPGILDYFIVW